MIVVRMLLNSWATLEARAPTLLSRCACRSCWRRASVSSRGPASISGPGMGSSPGRGRSVEGALTGDGIGRAEAASSFELCGPAAEKSPGFKWEGSRTGGVGVGGSGGGFFGLMGVAYLVRDVADPHYPPRPPGPRHLADRGVRDSPEPGPVGRIIPRDHRQQEHANHDP